MSTAAVVMRLQFCNEGLPVHWLLIKAWFSRFCVSVWLSYAKLCKLSIYLCMLAHGDTVIISMVAVAGSNDQNVLEHGLCFLCSPFDIQSSSFCRDSCWTPCRSTAVDWNVLEATCRALASLPLTARVGRADLDTGAMACGAPFAARLLLTGLVEAALASATSPCG